MGQHVFLFGEELPALFDGDLAEHSEFDSVELLVVLFVGAVKAVSVVSVSVLFVLFEGGFVIVAHLHVLSVAVKDLFELFHVCVFSVIEEVRRHHHDEVFIQLLNRLRLHLFFLLFVFVL